MTAELNHTAINGRQVPYRVDLINLEELKYWELNPRVYGAVRAELSWHKANGDERQAIIHSTMVDEQSTRKVMDALQRHGGQQEPLIVDGRSYEVIEGNSRLAALRTLAEAKPSHWGCAECKLYNDLTDEERYALLAEQHIHGKTTWSAYAKASTYWRQVKEDGWDVNKVAKVNRTSVPKVNSDVATIEMMRTNGDESEHRYSWYNILVVNKDVQKLFETNKGLEKRLVAVIQQPTEDRVDLVEKKADAFRDGLKALVKKKKALKRYCDGKCTLQEAVDDAETRGLEMKLRRVKAELERIEASDCEGITTAESNEGTRLLKRIRKKVCNIEKVLSEQARTG